MPLVQPRPPASRLPEGVELRGPFLAAAEVVLSTEALAFVAKLERMFGRRRRGLLARRRETQRKLDLGWKPEFPAETADIRASDWTVAPIPADLPGPPRGDHRPGGPQDGHQRAQLGRAASSWRTSRTRTRRPGRTASRARLNLRDAVARHDRRTSRPRRQGLSARSEQHRDADGAPARLAPRREARPRRRRSRCPARSSTSGSTSSTTPRELLARGSGPYFYLPEDGEPPRGAALERRLPRRAGRARASRAARSARRC